MATPNSVQRLEKDVRVNLTAADAEVRWGHILPDLSETRVPLQSEVLSWDGLFVMPDEQEDDLGPITEESQSSLSGSAKEHFSALLDDVTASLSDVVVETSGSAAAWAGLMLFVGANHGTETKTGTGEQKRWPRGVSTIN